MKLTESVRTPLNVLSGCAQLLNNPDSDLDWDDLQTISKQIDENCERIARAINKKHDSKQNEQAKGDSKQS